MQEHPHGAVDFGDLGKNKPQELIAERIVTVTQRRNLPRERRSTC
jgi:hypothetical protein